MAYVNIYYHREPSRLGKHIRYIAERPGSTGLHGLGSELRALRGDVAAAVRLLEQHAAQARTRASRSALLVKWVTDGPPPLAARSAPTASRALHAIGGRSSRTPPGAVQRSLAGIHRRTSPSRTSASVQHRAAPTRPTRARQERCRPTARRSCPRRVGGTTRDRADRGRRCRAQALPRKDPGLLATSDPPLRQPPARSQWPLTTDVRRLALREPRAAFRSSRRPMIPASARPYLPGLAHTQQPFRMRTASTLRHVSIR